MEGDTPESPSLATLLGDAMTAYVLGLGDSSAPAGDAPAWMAEWLTARGYEIRPIVHRSPTPQEPTRA